MIGAAAEAAVAALGRLTLSRRERMVMVEPRGTGMALFTLRAADEVRAPQFGSAEGELDAEMVAIAGAIIRQRTGQFDPSAYRDRYQEPLQQLIEAKTKGLTIGDERVIRARARDEIGEMSFQRRCGLCVEFLPSPAQQSRVGSVLHQRVRSGISLGSIFRGYEVA